MFNVRITTKAVEDTLFCRERLLWPNLHNAAVVLTLEWGSESPGGLAKHGLLAPPRLGLSRSGWGLHTCISSKFPQDAAIAGPTAHLETHRVEKRSELSLPVARAVNAWHQGSVLSVGVGDRGNHPGVFSFSP